jgi:hypothetical protein
VGDLESGGVGPRCAVHPDRTAAGTCERCGAFSCAQDYTAVAGRWLCAPCEARPDSDYLETFRLKYWGKRDVWAWLMGLAGVAHVATVVTTAAAGYLILVPLAVAVGAAEICYFLGPRWARAFIFAPVAEMILTPLLIWSRSPNELGLGTVSSLLAQMVVMPALPGLLGLAIFFNTRNQLFFREPVSEGRLKKAWDLYCNNTAARSGFLLSLLGIFVPGFGLLGVIFSTIGLNRVDPSAFPPIGRKKLAIAGIVLGAMETVGWVVLVATSMPRSAR